MPTELPHRWIEPPEASPTGTLACVIAVLLMLVLSYATLQQNVDPVAFDAVQFEGL